MFSIHSFFIFYIKICDFEVPIFLFPQKIGNNTYTVFILITILNENEKRNRKISRNKIKKQKKNKCSIVLFNLKIKTVNLQEYNFPIFIFFPFFSSF